MLLLQKQIGQNKIDKPLYADEKEVFAISETKFKEIFEIYNQTFTRFDLTMAYSKTDSMAFNVSEVKAKQHLF